MAELDAMLRMLYGTPDADPEVLRLLAVNGSGDEDALTLDEFVQVKGSLFREMLGLGVSQNLRGAGNGVGVARIEPSQLCIGSCSTKENTQMQHHKRCTLFVHMPRHYDKV